MKSFQKAKGRFHPVKLLSTFFLLSFSGYLTFQFFETLSSPSSTTLYQGSHIAFPPPLPTAAIPKTLCWKSHHFLPFPDPFPGPSPVLYQKIKTQQVSQTGGTQEED